MVGTAGSGWAQDRADTPEPGGGSRELRGMGYGGRVTAANGRWLGLLQQRQDERRFAGRHGRIAEILQIAGHDEVGASLAGRD